MSSIFYIPSVNLLGDGALTEAITLIKNRGFKHPLIVSDQMLVKIGMVETVTKQLEQVGLKVSIFDKVQPNPTTKNVKDGLEILKSHQCDAVITLGGWFAS
ncbi:iron-containing alcohol dehydrogenase [Entomospira entomophila]|uniref:iron-containing alcohol dehydrogenase n=1 Tax=Entomospira entomophila TaxID=2719988 RepID=UPI001BB05F96|nr:iron-containing alcohol dehydrogenase [Entomospira entomophilus]WDI34972.1 iron-containing alcohol dehydrogenase [Entomospira entomophilus]